MTDYPTNPDGTPDFAHMTPDQVKAYGASLGGPAAVTDQPIGLGPGKHAVGIHNVANVGPGMERFPAQVSPAERGARFTQYDTIPKPGQPYKAQDVLDPGAGTTDEILTMQAKLFQAGLLSLSSLHRGIWDAPSQNAYKVVLAFANQHGMSKDDAMDLFLNNPVGAKTKTPAAYTYENPVNVAAEVSGGGPGQSNIARDTVGQDLSPGETQGFVDWYQQQEQKAHDQLQSANLAGEGAGVAGAPNLGAAAQAYIKQHNLAQATAYGTASRMLQFFDLLKTPGGHP